MLGGLLIIFITFLLLGIGSCYIAIDAGNKSDEIMFAHFYMNKENYKED